VTAKYARDREGRKEMLNLADGDQVITASNIEFPSCTDSRYNNGFWKPAVQQWSVNEGLFAGRGGSMFACYLRGMR
jgi:hypothetical protein